MAKITHPYAIASSGKTKHFIIKRRVGHKQRFEIIAQCGSDDVATQTMDLLNKGYLFDEIGQEMDGTSNQEPVAHHRIVRDKLKTVT